MKYFLLSMTFIPLGIYFFHLYWFLYQKFKPKIITVIFYNNICAFTTAKSKWLTNINIKSENDERFSLQKYKNKKCSTILNFCTYKIYKIKISFLSFILLLKGFTIFYYLVSKKSLELLRRIIIFNAQVATITYLKDTSADLKYLNF